MEPFQIVRIRGASKSSRDTGTSGPGGNPPTYSSSEWQRKSPPTRCPRRRERSRARSRGCGGTRSRRSGRSPPTSSSATTAGTRSRGRRRRPLSRSSPWLSVSARATRSGSSARRASSGRSSTSTLARTLFIGAAIYANSAAKDCEYILDHSESVGVLVEDDEQLAKLDDYGRGTRASNTSSATRTSTSCARVGGVRSGAPGRARGHDGDGEPGRRVRLHLHVRRPVTKACMIRRNYYAMAAVVDEIDDFTMSDDTMLLYLPLAHNFGRLMHLARPYVGFTLAFLPNPLRAGEALKRSSRRSSQACPASSRRCTRRCSRSSTTRPARRKIVDWALRVGRKASVRRAAGKPLGPVLGAQHRLADRLVYSKVKANLGGNFRIGISGGAPLARRSPSSSTRSTSSSSRATA